MAHVPQRAATVEPAITIHEASMISVHAIVVFQTSPRAESRGALVAVDSLAEVAALVAVDSLAAEVAALVAVAADSAAEAEDDIDN